MKIKQQRDAEVLHPCLHPLPHLRPPPLCAAQVRRLPHLLPRTCLQGSDPRRAQGQLVNRSRRKEVYQMLVNDPIADMLTRIRNALIARHDTVTDSRFQHEEGASPRFCWTRATSRAVDYIDDGAAGPDQDRPEVRARARNPSSRASSASPSPACASTPRTTRSPRSSAAWASPSFPRPRA